LAEDTIKEKEIVFGRWANSLEESAVNFQMLDRTPTFIVTYSFGDEAIDKLRILFATTFDPHLSRVKYHFAIFDLRGVTVLYPSGMAFLQDLRDRLRGMGGELFIAVNTRRLNEEDRRRLELEFAVSSSLEDALIRAREARAKTTIADQVSK